MKHKSFCTAKKIIIKQKDNLQDGKKIFSNKVIDKCVYEYMCVCVCVFVCV